MTAITVPESLAADGLHDLLRNRSISQEELADLLWGEEERSSNPINALKTMFHRVRSLLNQLDSTAGHTLIIRQEGTYAWNQEIPFSLDTDDFEALCRKGASEEDEDRRLETDLQALALYGGDFLPKLSAEPWVVPISAYFHNLYIRTVQEVLPCWRAAAAWMRQQLCAARAWW